MVINFFLHYLNHKFLLCTLKKMFDLHLTIATQVLNFKCTNIPLDYVYPLVGF